MSSALGLSLVGCADAARLCSRITGCDGSALPGLEAASTGAMSMHRMSERFYVWFDAYARASAAPVRDLIFNFHNPQGDDSEALYPLLSGKAILWLLEQDRVDEAQRIARGLLAHQQGFRHGAWRRTYGAFPSLIWPKRGRWVVSNLYYSGDTLCIVEALVALHERTHERPLLESALAAGRWVTRVMCQAHTFGILAENHGAPIQHMSADGVPSRQIHTNVEMLWLGALTRLGRVANEPEHARQADRAYEFLRRAQTRSGGYMDHYDAGDTPRPYDPRRWKPYARGPAFPQGQVIADNCLRAALGAVRMGDLAAAQRTHDWLQVDAGGVPAYLDLETGEAAFLPSDAVYFDVVSSALHRNLSDPLGRREASSLATRFLEEAQQLNGGWYWGMRRDTREPLTLEQAPIIGFWATADLATRV